MEESKIKVVMCEPSMVAKVIEIDNELETFQRIVGGCIEEYMPTVSFEKGENSYDTN